MSVASGTKHSYLSDAKREKLLDIQKKEKLKGLLVSKFKKKYGEEKNVDSVINYEVSKFMKNERLTEDNLRNLDTKISRQTLLKAKK
jgi:hypothetical protein